MKKILSILILTGIFYSCGVNKSLQIMKSPTFDFSSLKGSNILLESGKCKSVENIAIKSLESLNMTILKNNENNPKFKCILDCKIIYNNSSHGKNISKINLKLKLYTFEKDIIVYTMGLSDSNFNGVDMEKFKSEYLKEFKRSIM